MQSDKRIILIGGFCETYELCRRCGIEVIGVVDRSIKVLAGYDFHYLGTDEEFIANKQKYLNIPLVVVPDKPKCRMQIVERYRAEGFRFGRLISPDADVSESAELGEGVVVHPYAVISAKAKIGNFVRINLHGVVGHGAVVEDYVNVAALAIVSGESHIKRFAYIGMHSVMLPRVTVGENSVVSIGSAVVSKVPDNKVVIGVPAEVLWDNE